jgi:hypothetical protein
MAAAFFLAILGGLFKISRGESTQKPLNLNLRVGLLQSSVFSGETHRKYVLMRRTASGALVLLTSGILIGVFVALASRRFEVCDETPLPRLPARVAAVANSPAPTPAPPRELVTLQIQADKSGLEVSWADN